MFPSKLYLTNEPCRPELWLLCCIMAPRTAEGFWGFAASVNFYFIAILSSVNTAMWTGII